MYVAPRPDVNEDPLFAVRLATVGVLSYIAVLVINPTLPPIIAALSVGMIGAQRKAFSMGKAIGGPLAMIVLTYAMAWLVQALHSMPLVYIGVMWLLYFAGFHAILKTGAPAGMLIVIVTVLMSVMGMHGATTVEAMRVGFLQASLVALVLAPLVYLLFPPRTTEQHLDRPQAGGGNVRVGAAIRATILLGLSFWLYAVMQPSDMMMAVIAAMVLVFPTRRAVFFEAVQRIRATLYGGAVALGVLALFTMSPHLPILLCLIFLGCLWLASGMLSGPHPSNVYQYAISVALSLIAGALSTQDAGYATFTRIVLTLTGAFTAAFAVALLDALTRWQKEQSDSPSNACAQATPPH
ncbi:FUSC family protein [Halomonas marinisediminis]|uniref:FUSC family protein n=1 Tax=Halomonas marinisediminis TaxID=2546095 RepID=A0ABY2D8A6_9GAMM|nr:FUSC family protein [Halomonas marinisediminis]TDB03300.1 FUSC family protein [Halomonas marinisediminis]